MLTTWYVCMLRRQQAQQWVMPGHSCQQLENQMSVSFAVSDAFATEVHEKNTGGTKVLTN
eukprot:346578-Amphidinium_carterae.2